MEFGNVLENRVGYNIVVARLRPTFQLDPRHTRHCYAQNCNIAIKRYWNKNILQKRSF